MGGRGSTSASRSVQVIAAEPSHSTSAAIQVRLLQSLHSHGHPCQIWMPPHARVPELSPWHPLLKQGWVQTRLHPSPGVIVVCTAADWKQLRQHYGPQPSIPVLHLLFGCDGLHYGHGGAGSPAIRVCSSPELAATLQQQDLLREPLHSLPIGLNPADVPVPAADRDPKRVLLLARHRPDLGLLLQQKLEHAGLNCSAELEPWPQQRWLSAMAQASTVVNLNAANATPTLGLRRLSSMVLQTLLISEHRSGIDALCRNGENALVRPADPDQLLQAVLSVHSPNGKTLRRRLLDGGLSTALRHRATRQEMNFLDLFATIPELWMEAKASHRSKNER